MLKPLYDLAAQLLSLNRDTQQNKADIREIRQEIRELQQEIKEVRQQVTDLRLEFRDLIMVVQRLASDMRRGQENEAHEREKMALRLENEFLRSRKRLPPAKPDTGKASDGRPRRRRSHALRTPLMSKL